MKKLLFLVVIIFLPIIAYFQYTSWKRFASPTEYVYTIADGIDMHYHDQALVEEYFNKAIEIDQYARQKYYNEDIDVRYPDEGNVEALNASKYYNRLVARVKYIEALLLKSAELKSGGSSNMEIKELEESGLDRATMQKQKLTEQHVGLKFGDQNNLVWNIQKKLTEQGYAVPIDGLFGPETESQLKEFQQAKNLFPSGTVDAETAELLFRI